jgi:hypothetical protein
VCSSDLYVLCQPRFANVVAGVPALPCGAPDLDPVWHHLTFDTSPGDAVDIYLSPTSAPADLFALYTDRDGRYGLDAGESELDSEEECDVAAYGDCPATCRTATGGTAHLWIAQRDCTGPADYRVWLEVNGATPAVTIETDVPGPR